MKVSILSAGEVESSLAHAALVNGINVDRVDRRADVLKVSDALAEQVRAVQIQGDWPAPAAGAGAELCDVAHGQTVYHMRTVAASDLKLHRTDMSHLLGDINVLVLHAKYHQPVARFLPLARALYLQQELRLSASEALYEALGQIYGITREQLLSERPKLAGRIDKLEGAKWTIDLTKNTPAERYPLHGINPQEARPLYRALDDVIIVACRRVAPEQKLLTEVLNESNAPLIIVFAGDEELAFAPGLSIDWLKMSQAIVAPRPGVTYIAEPLVDLRLANDAETISQLEGLNPQAGLMIWSAILAQKPARVRDPFSPIVSKAPRSIMIAGAILVPIFLLLMAMFSGFVAAIATVGVMMLIALEAYMVYSAWQRPTAAARETTPAPATAPPPSAIASENVPPAAEPTATTTRRQRITAGLNGHAHAK